MPLVAIHLNFYGDELLVSIAQNHIDAIACATERKLNCMAR
jgi:hypothetical protein